MTGQGPAEPQMPGGEPQGQPAGGTPAAADIQQRGTQLEDVQALREELNRARAEAAKYRTQLRQAYQQTPAPGGSEPQPPAAVPATEGLTQVQAQLKALEERLNAEQQARRATELKLIQAELKLPDGLMGRLQGETVEELRQDAEKLARELQGLMPKGAVLSPTNPVADGEQGAGALATQIFQMRRGGLEQGMNLVGDLLDGRHRGS